MKKTRKNYKRNLPRYVLGTLGYQPNKGLGDATFLHLEGESLAGDVKTAKLTQLPNAMNKALQSVVAPAMEINKHWINAPTSATMPGISLSGAALMYPTLSGLAPTTTAAAMASKYAPLLGGGTAAIGSTMGSLSTTGQLGSLSASSPSAFFGTGLLTLPASRSAVSGASAGGASKVLSTAGKVAGGLATAYGLYNVGSDIANAGTPGVTQQQIANSAGTNTYTTAGGSTYKERTGIDSANALELERQAKNQKQIGLTMDAAGLGMSAGALAGSLGALGSVGGPWGSVIGLGVGALAGGIASLLGFGDNSDEVERMIKDQQDVFAMQNRQSRATALDLDTKSAFYDRAAYGKRPVWSPTGLVDGKATARVSNGELIGNFEDGYVTRVSGEKNNKDTKLAKLKSSDFVISNKYGLSDYAAVTGDYVGALALQELIMGMRNAKGYKNGRLPRRWLGLNGDKILSLVPHFASLITNLNALREAQNMPVETYDAYSDNAEGRKAVNTLGSLIFDDTLYTRNAQNNLNYANWDARRNVGLGIGGRAVAMNANYRAYLDALAGVNLQKNEANAKYSTIYAQALANLGAANQQHRINAAAQKYQWRQQANAAKYNAIQQYRSNRDQAALNGVAEWLKQGQYQDALAAQNRMLRLYEQEADLDQLKYNNSLRHENTDVSPASLIKSYQVLQNMFGPTGNNYLNILKYWK